MYACNAYEEGKASSSIIDIMYFMYSRAPDCINFMCGGKCMYMHFWMRTKVENYIPHVVILIVVCIVALNFHLCFAFVRFAVYQLKSNLDALKHACLIIHRTFHMHSRQNVSLSACLRVCAVCTCMCTCNLFVTHMPQNTCRDKMFRCSASHQSSAKATFIVVVIIIIIKLMYWKINRL